MSISIVIPSYNQQEYLADCIESTISQGAYEVIVVDDGSTDNSLEIAKKYPVKVISQVNKGLASARNTGIMNVTGDYILFLDADDMLLEGAVDKIQTIINQNSASVVAPSFKTFGVVNESIILMENPTVEDFKDGNRIGYCAAIKRSDLLEIGGYSPKMTYGWEDYHLWFNLLARGKKIVTIPEVLWLYRTKERSMIHEANEHREELFAQINNDFHLW